MDSKTVIIALVAIVLIAGVGYFVISGDDAPEQEVEYDGNLLVFGNANNDDYINEKDIDTIKDIIANGWDSSANPLADADHNGSVDDADVKFVETMIDGKADAVWFMDCTDAATKLDLPVKNIASFGYGSHIGLQVLNKHGDVVARSGDKSLTMLDPVRDVTIQKTADLSPKTPFKVDLGLLTTFLEKTPIDMILGDGHYLKAQEKQLNALGIDVVCMDLTDEEIGNSCMLTLGYLLGSVELSQQYVQFMTDLEDDIKEKLSGVAPADRVSCISMLMSGIFNNEASKTGWSAWPVKAGAINPVTPSMLEGADKKFVSKGDTWHLTKAYDVPFIAEFTPFGYGDKADAYAPKWDSLMEQVRFDKMSPTYYPNNLMFVNWNLFTWVGIAYLAENFYPDLFGEGYGDKAHQEFVDKFFPDLVAQDYKVSEHCFVAKYDDVKPFLKYVPTD